MNDMEDEFRIKHEIAKMIAGRQPSIEGVNKATDDIYNFFKSEDGTKHSWLSGDGAHFWCSNCGDPDNANAEPEWKHCPDCGVYMKHHIEEESTGTLKRTRNTIGTPYDLGSHGGLKNLAKNYRHR